MLDQCYIFAFGVTPPCGMCFVCTGGRLTGGKRRLYLTDGTKEVFPGLALFFLKTTTRPITTSNIADVRITVHKHANNSINACTSHQKLHVCSIEGITILCISYWLY